MATSSEAKAKFGRKLSQLVHHFNLDAATLTSLSALFTVLAAIETTGIARLRDIGKAINDWIAAQ